MNYASTGRIMMDIAELARNNGYEYLTCSANSRVRGNGKAKNHYYFCGRISRAISMRLGKFTGKNGMFARIPTLRLLAKIKKFKPDIIHLHNLHNNYVNLPMLFKYVKKNNIKVVWTLHDCWAFTGHCPHYVIAQCDKWKTECYDCPSYKNYPVSRIDRSNYIYNKKKEWFLGVENMWLVTPSSWLYGEVKQSFLKGCNAVVINNGIDLSIYNPKPTEITAKKYGLEGKKVILGVAYSWGYKKGLDVFIALSKILSADYKIVLVGTDDEIEKSLPSNIVSVMRTKNREELASPYTLASVFLNPTREEMFGLTNVEVLATGTPVITFDTGGCPEIVNDKCGEVLKNTLLILRNVIYYG